MSSSENATIAFTGKEPVTKFIQNILVATDVFISRAQLETIASAFEPRAFRKKELFVKQGKVNDESFFMTHGFMRAYTHGIDGQEITTYFYGSNRPVFEAASLFTKTPSLENIQALTDCEGFSLPFEKLNKLFHNVPEFREYGRAMLAKEFLLYKKRTLSMINQTAEERYEELISTEKEIFKYAQLKQIASYLGVTDTSLSRIRREFHARQLRLVG